MAYSKGGKRYRKKKMSEDQVDKLIDSKIKQQREDKQLSSASGNSGTPIPHNSSITQGDLQRVIGSMPQGVEDGQRVGNEVVCKTLNIRGITQMYFGKSDSRSRIGVRVLVFSVKAFPNGADAIANASEWIHSILRHGAQPKGFEGSIEDYLLPLNTDVITCHSDKRFTLTQPFVYSTGVVPASTQMPIQQQYSTKTWNINVKCKNKVLKFSRPADQGPVGEVPNNYGPLIAVGYCHLDGSAPDVATTAISQSFVSTLRYEDR